MSKIQEFKDMINGIDDEELLDAAQQVLDDMCEIANLKEKVDMLQKNIMEGKRSVFWFFADALDSDEVSMAAETVIGRRRVMHDRAEKIRKKKEQEELEKSSEQSAESVIAEEV